MQAEHSTAETKLLKANFFHVWFKKNQYNPMIRNGENCGIAANSNLPYQDPVHLPISSSLHVLSPL
jgi:hypothetical protein